VLQFCRCIIACQCSLAVHSEYMNIYMYMYMNMCAPALLVRPGASCILTSLLRVSSLLVLLQVFVAAEPRMSEDVPAAVPVSVMAS
jgi:hypothetical protein